MDFFNRLGALYQLLTVPALAHDMAAYGPQTDLAYRLAYATQGTSVPIDVYPADTQTLEG